jgi:hypothetical protein
MIDDEWSVISDDDGLGDAISSTEAMEDCRRSLRCLNISSDLSDDDAGVCGGSGGDSVCEAIKSGFTSGVDVANESISDSTSFDAVAGTVADDDA